MSAASLHLYGFPNKGSPITPDTSDEKHEKVLIGFSLIDNDDERSAILDTYVEGICDVENKPLEEALRRARESVAGGDADFLARIEAQKSAAAGSREFDTVASAERLVPRDGWARVMTFLAISVIILFIVTEAKLLSHLVMVTGAFKLRPDSLLDFAFSVAFAGSPVAWAALKYAQNETLTDQQREANLASMIWSSTRVGIPLWIAGFAAIIAPNFTPSVPSEPDPDRSAAFNAVKEFAFEMKMLIGSEFIWVSCALFIVAVLYATSIIIAAILIAHRESVRRSLRQVAIPSAAKKHCEERIAGIRGEQHKDAITVGTLDGMLKQVTQVKVVVKAQFAAEVNVLRQRARVAGVKAILEANNGGGAVIDALPLFRRR